MKTKFSMVFLTMILAIIALLTAAKHPTGPNTVSFDEPTGFWISFGMLVVLFVPPLILSFFNHSAVKIVSVIYQAFIVIGFSSMVPIGFIISNGFWVGVVGIIGAVVSICSIIVTIKIGSKRKFGY